jgi:hypothetical protein
MDQFHRKRTAHATRRHVALVTLLVVTFARIHAVTDGRLDAMPTAVVLPSWRSEDARVHCSGTLVAHVF